MAMPDADRAAELGHMLDAICGENLRGVREHHLETVRRVRWELIYGSPIDGSEPQPQYHNATD